MIEITSVPPRVDQGQPGMIDNRLLFHLIASMILLIIGTRAGAIYFKWRTKHNLTTLIIVLILFVGGILSYFYPGELIPGAGTAIQISLGAIFILLLSALLFYPQIKRFPSQRKIKNK
jgi:drug/metabolite transporter (DMT)-like permease